MISCTCARPNVSWKRKKGGFSSALTSQARTVGERTFWLHAEKSGAVRDWMDGGRKSEVARRKEASEGCWGRRRGLAWKKPVVADEGAGSGIVVFWKVLRWNRIQSRRISRIGWVLVGKMQGRILHNYWKRTVLEIKMVSMIRSDNCLYLTDSNRGLGYICRRTSQVSHTFP